MRWILDFRFWIEVVYAIGIALIIPVLILSVLLIWHMVSQEFQDRNSFISNAGRMVYTPYLIITREKVGNIYSVGFEAGWLGKWFGVQWNFLDVRGREYPEPSDWPDQCPDCKSFNTTPIGSTDADYVVCNTCGHTWRFEFKSPSSTEAITPPFIRGNRKEVAS